MSNNRYIQYCVLLPWPVARLAVLLVLLSALVFASACQQLEPVLTQTDTTVDTSEPDSDITDITDQDTETSLTDSTDAEDTGTDPSDTDDNGLITDTETSGESAAETDEPDLTDTGTSTIDNGETTPVSTTTRTTTRSAETTRSAATTTTTRAATTTTRAATTTTTTRAPTATPTPVPTATPTPVPTATPVPQSDFPHRNHGTLFRNQFNTSSQITEKDGIFIGTANSAHGVVLVRVNSSAIPADTRCKAIFLDSNQRPTYQYDILVRDKYVALPLNMGNGQYNLRIAKNVGGTSYQVEMSHSFNVSLSSSLRPYTASSIATDFSTGSTSVQRANQLTSGHSTTDGKVDAVYRWIVSNISYDRNLQQRVSSGEIYAYWPDPDRTMSSRRGICFDYASLMCAMLRSQGIPTRMIIGPVRTSSGDIEHAWNEVYFEGRGWVVVAEFSWQQVSGTAWVHFDTTFAAGGISPSDIQKYDYSRRNRIY